MPPLLQTTLLLLHLLGAVAWVGGMFFAHFCLRPAAVETLEPPKRLPLMGATLRQFFRYVAASVVLLLGTGFALFLPVGFQQAPVGWHIMLALGVVMALVFAYIWAAPVSPSFASTAPMLLGLWQARCSTESAAR